MKKFTKNLKIRHRIILVPAIVGITFLAIILTITAINLQSSKLMKKIRMISFPLLDLSNDLEEKLTDIQRGMIDAVTNSDSLVLVEIGEEIQELYSRIDSAIILYPEVQEELVRWRQSFPHYFSLARHVTTSLIQGETSVNLIQDQQAMIIEYNKIRDDLQDFEQQRRIDAEYAIDLNQASFDHTLRLLIMLMVLGTAILVLISWKLSRSITVPLREVVHVANCVAKGDLDVKITVESNDEISQLKRAFEAMIKRITRLIREKDEAYDEIFKSRDLHQQNAGELTQMNANLSQEIAERKKAEDELNKHKFHLEELVEGRTKELQAANAMLQAEINYRKEIEAALRVNERKYFSLFNQIPDPIFILDRESKLFLDCNKRVQKVYGYSLEELRTKTPLDMHPPEERQAVIENIGNKNMPPELTFKHVTKSGHEFDVEVIVDEIEYQGRQAFLSIVRDISERKQAEAKKNELLQELQSVNQELKDFAYVVSHDLKAPLRGIGSLSEWLLVDYGDKLDDAGKDLVNLLDSRVKRMHKLIEGILQYSRVGRVREEVVEVDLNESLVNIIDLLSPPDHIAITVEPDMPVVQFEKTRIEQVFQNLLSNAIKYMDKDEGKITVSKTEDDEYYQFCVTDNGPGIDARHHDKIFQIFQTLNPRDEFESTGVGLTLIKKIIKMYSGEIWLESKPGEGSSFYFTVPKNKIDFKNVAIQELETGNVQVV